MAIPFIPFIAFFKFEATFVSVIDGSLLNIFVESHTRISHLLFPIFLNFSRSVFLFITGFSSIFQSAVWIMFIPPIVILIAFGSGIECATLIKLHLNLPMLKAALSFNILISR